MSMPLLKLTELNEYRPPSHDDTQLIHDAIIVPLALLVVERNRSELDRKARSLRSIFVRAADIIIAKMKADLKTNTRLLILKGITVYRDKPISSKVSYRYNCRGFEDELSFTQSYIRNEINTLISAYNAELFTKSAPLNE